MRCNRPSLGGGNCELEQGHEGKHRITRERQDGPWVWEWTDEGQQKVMDKWGSRFD